MTSGLNFTALPLRGEDTGEGELVGFSPGPLSLAFSHEGRGNLGAFSLHEISAWELKLGLVKHDLLNPDDSYYLAISRNMAVVFCDLPRCKHLCFTLRL